MPSQPSQPVYASFPSSNLTIGAGVAIFHLATARVVLCWDTRREYWLLPKGRRNANESTSAAAEREGYEESGYRNRLLPLPFKHRQTQPDEGHQRFVTEPLWVQLMPVAPTVQYLLLWFAAETVGREVEEGCCTRELCGGAAVGRRYQPPEAFPDGLTLEQRAEQDSAEANGGEQMYRPVRHEGTGVDEDELGYESYLLPIDEARRKLRGSVMEEVIRRGWEAIELRREMEENVDS